jgi:alkanesulfonate monooxygenase SsuD/methylene tetrahydromethanopterin reductase-like flavin-dependent oxidoreductase (luciferase family)
MAQPGKRPLKVGILLPQAEFRWDGRTPRWRDLEAMVRLTEDVGFDSVWVVDHFLFRQPDQPTEGFWECLTLLSALAAATSRVELGTLVVCTNWRNPGLIAKMADTIDEISGGRLILGLGAGYHEPEFRACGFPYDHRYSRFEEALVIIHRLLREGSIDSFEGRFYQMRECELRPRGPRPQGPPILIGSTGHKMLRLAARYADIWNTYYSGTGNRVEGVPPLQTQVDEACTEVGRDPATLERSATVLVGFEGHGPIYGVVAEPLTGPPERLAEEFRAYARAGIAHLQVRVEPNTLAGIERLAPALELLDRG